MLSILSKVTAFESGEWIYDMSKSIKLQSCALNSYIALLLLKTFLYGLLERILD